MTGAPTTRATRLYAAVPWIAGLVAFAIAARKLIGGYDDIGIYLDVAREFTAGGFDLCRERADSGPWVYPPCAALPFVLLENTLGNDGARWVWCASLGVATALLLRSLAHLTRPFGGLSWWQWAVFGALFQRCIAQNLSHGNLSLWVGALVTMGCADIVRERGVRGGLWLGLATACKVTPALFVPALLLAKRPRAALSTALTIAVAVLLLPWPFCGTSEHLRHLHDFWRTATEAALSPDDAAITATRTGPSIGGTVDYLLQPRPADADGHTVNLFDVDDTTLLVVRTLWSLLLAGLLAWWFFAARRLDDGRRLVHQLSAVSLAIAFFAPLVRVYHLTAALIAGVLFARGPKGRGDWLWHATAVGLLMTMTLRQRNLIGEAAWRYLDLGAFLHVTLVAMTVWLLRDARRAGAAQ